MNKLIYIFLDIDGVLNSENYLTYRYNLHKKPMSMNAVPFDPKCLYNLMLFVQILNIFKYDTKIILSSTWRLHEIDYEIVNSRLAEYGLRLSGKTPVHEHNRGIEIKEFLKNKPYYDIVIFDDEDFDIKTYYKDKFIKVNAVTGLNRLCINHALKNIIYGGDDMSKWNDQMVSKNMQLDDAIDFVDQMYQEKMSILEHNNTIDISQLDNVKFTNFEFAAVRLLREVQSLQSKLDNSVKIEDVQNLLNEITNYFQNNSQSSNSEIQVFILSKIIDLINK